MTNGGRQHNSTTHEARRHIGKPCFDLAARPLQDRLSTYLLSPTTQHDSVKLKDDLATEGKSSGKTFDWQPRHLRYYLARASSKDAKYRLARGSSGAKGCRSDRRHQRRAYGHSRKIKAIEHSNPSAENRDWWVAESALKTLSDELASEALLVRRFHVVRSRRRLGAAKTALLSCVVTAGVQEPETQGHFCRTTQT